MADPGVIGVNIASGPALLRVNTSQGPGVVNVNTGTPGPIGLTGATGATGEQGEQGERGEIGPSGEASGVVNLADYSPYADNVNNDAYAFQAFTDDYQGLDVELYIPPGTYRVLSNAGNGTPNGSIFEGIRRLKVNGYGVKIRYGTNGWTFGCPVTYNATNTTGTALIAAADQGDTSVTLLDVGDATKFAADGWLWVTALDMQGTGSNPPNHWFSEYVQISSISGTTINLKTPLKNSYAITYPAYDDTPINQGGPATIRAQPASWDTHIEMCGVEFIDTGNVNINGWGRSIHYTDCIFTSGYPLFTMHQKASFVGCKSVSGSWDLDKNIEHLLLKDSQIGVVTCESASIERMVIDNCTIKQLWGTPKNVHIRDSHITTLNVGPRGYGYTKSVLIENSCIQSLQDNGNFMDDADGNWTLTDGVLSQANSANNSWSNYWAIPGAKLRFQRQSGLRPYPPTFTVLDVAAGGGGGIGTGTIDVTTTLPSAYSTEIDYIRAIPCNEITVRGCYGSKRIQELSRAPAGKPMHTYNYAVLTGNCNSSNDVTFDAYGYLVMLRINVLRAYTGSAAATLALTASNLEKVANATLTSSSVSGLSIDLATAGERIISPNGNSRVSNLDVLVTIASDDWFNTLVSPDMTLRYDADISSDSALEWPIVEVELITDQGFANGPVIYTGATVV
jgi:hypothetical protein